MKLSGSFIPVLIAACLTLQSCDRRDTASTGTGKASNDEHQSSPVTAGVSTRSPVNTVQPGQTQFNIGNKSYLFDVSDHSVEELEALLQRAEEIGQFEKDNYGRLEIVMILHGPDIEWFTRENYENNRQLVDLAKKLDSYEIIDMKVCETAMAGRGVSREEVPEFIESVPYSPVEMQRLLREGYINL